MQGKASEMAQTVKDFRITPACAGKRRAQQPRRGAGQDHPCVCREKQTLDSAGEHYIGSPLRVQGKGDV